MILVDSLVSQVLLFGSFNAQTGYTDEVINSGKLSILKDNDLKKQLTSWHSNLVNSEEDYQLRISNYVEILSPILAKHFPVANGDKYIDYSHWSDSYKPAPRSRSPFKSNLDDINLLALENALWYQKLNNDFIILNDTENKKFVMRTLEMINKNLANK